MDWPKLLRDLREAGFTQEEVAVAIGASQSGISDLVTGRTKNPSFVVGDKLRQLHAAKCQTAKVREPVPKAA